MVWLCTHALRSSDGWSSWSWVCCGARTCTRTDCCNALCLCVRVVSCRWISVLYVLPSTILEYVCTCGLGLAVNAIGVHICKFGRQGAGPPCRRPAPGLDGVVVVCRGQLCAVDAWTQRAARPPCNWLLHRSALQLAHRALESATRGISLLLHYTPVQCKPVLSRICPKRVKCMTYMDR